jgi:hypothetical protein
MNHLDKEPRGRPEIEITPEMIGVGTRLLAEWYGTLCDSTDADVAAEVFKAMAAASPRGGR